MKIQITKQVLGGYDVLEANVIASFAGEIEIKSELGEICINFTELDKIYQLMLTAKLYGTSLK